MPLINNSVDTDRLAPSSDNKENEEYAEMQEMVDDLEEDFESEDEMWMQRARDAYHSSSAYVDTNYRKQWEDSIDLFNSVHPSGSKYHNSIYDKRSKIFRPKTRAIIRKTEAAGAAAYFSNQDILNVEALNQADKMHVLDPQ